MKIGIGIGIVKSPKNRLESVSVRIGKRLIGLKDFLSFLQAYTLFSANGESRFTI